MPSAMEFLKLGAAKQRRGRGEPLTSEEEALLAKYPEFKALCGYNGCQNELGPRADGEHHKIGGNPVCETCYFDAFDEATPIGVLRPRIRGAY